MTPGTVIVGASVAGIGAANELRRLGYTDPITLIDSQPHLPYDRPPLSKSVLTGQVELDAIAFHQRGHYEDLKLTIRAGVRAIGLDAADRRVLLDTGEDITGDSVLIATGARARPFPVDEHSGTVWTIRELEDARDLAQVLTGGTRVAIIGGGFIGAEVASSARHLGCEVTVIEVSRLPFEPLLGAEVAVLLAELHRAAGTELRCGVLVTRVESLGPGQRLHMADGTVIDADVVVAGLGAIPNVEWLAGSKLVVDGVIPCDSHGRTAAQGIWAAGDVAAWHHPGLGLAYRHEHWTSARDQARIVAHDIAGVAGPRWEVNVPYVWSDQYGKRIQVLGYPAGADTVKVLEHDPARQSFLAVYGRAGRLVAVVGCNAAAKVMRYRPKLEDGIPLDKAY
jgi:3-phenylpropionate/trans-cinnamate dioxygenase ferredoxin reductase component